MTQTPISHVAAQILCGPIRVRDLFVKGRRMFADWQMVTIGLPRVIERQNELAHRLMG